MRSTIFGEQKCESAIAWDWPSIACMLPGSTVTTLTCCQSVRRWGTPRGSEERALVQFAVSKMCESVIAWDFGPISLVCSRVHAYHAYC